jgi:hypothetical protein
MPRVAPIVIIVMGIIIVFAALTPDVPDRLRAPGGHRSAYPGSALDFDEFVYLATVEPDALAGRTDVYHHARPFYLPQLLSAHRTVHRSSF